MTAIVGILNRRGIAFAADSAATHISKAGHKISNNSNKIFSLSKYQPVGIALYNNLDFIGVPWDSIIKQFRCSLKETKYDTLQDYVKPFFDFVRYYCVNSLQKEQTNYLHIIVRSYFNEVCGLVEKEIGSKITDANADIYFQKAQVIMDNFLNKFKLDQAEDFKDYKIDDFDKYAKDTIDSIISPLSTNQKCPVTFRSKFVNSLFALLCNNSHVYLNSIYTGLVFFGYGEKDIFPSLFEYQVTYAIDNRIKYTLINKYSIDSTPNSALIAPFAQTDVANTVIRAVEDRLRQIFYDNFNKTLQGLRDEIVNQLITAKAPMTFVDIFKNLNINKYANDYKNGMDKFIRNNYIQPLMDTVSFLDKEDLADMAESLVRMTCLKRHVTTDEETVGGPVDVAIVTKGDGFIWKKRKHYFEPEFNSQFFERYKK